MMLEKPHSKILAALTPLLSAAVFVKRIGADAGTAREFDRIQLNVDFNY